MSDSLSEDMINKALCWYLDADKLDQNFKYNYLKV